jgi:hypothetical protein
MYSDSHVSLNEQDVIKALEEDRDTNGCLITHAELEKLCLGDEEGDVSAMSEKFPALHELLNKYF